MNKPKYLYHGSGKKLVGDMLLPKRANDLGNKEYNSLTGVYASSERIDALTMAIHSCKGVEIGSAQTHKVNGKFEIKDSIIYKGWPKQKYIYLYTLPSKTFKNLPKGTAQWVSMEPVKPIKIEKLLVDKNIHLIRRPTQEEKKEFFKKHNIK